MKKHDVTSSKLEAIRLVAPPPEGRCGFCTGDTFHQPRCSVLPTLLAMLESSAPAIAEMIPPDRASLPHRARTPKGKGAKGLELAK